jgi:1-acyl-sn-glycerol-3-phosphate acyltransferase
MKAAMIYRYLRVGGRLAGISSATAVIYSIWITGKALTGPHSPRRLRLRNAVVRGWARTLSAFFRMRIEVRGQAPAAPFFLVCNHLSYIDIIALSTQLDCVFIAKSDIADWPLVGTLAKSVGTIFINRDSFQDIPRVITLIEEAMSEGHGVVLFPEGTSTSGESILPFSPALLEPAARSRLPVHYASISYWTPPAEIPAHLAICWWGEMTFVPHFIGALGLKRFEAQIDFGAQTIVDNNRKALARRLREAVADQFVPVVRGESECTAKEN